MSYKNMLEAKIPRSDTTELSNFQDSYEMNEGRFPTGLKNSTPEQDQKFGSRTGTDIDSLEEQVKFNKERHDYLKLLRESDCDISNALAAEQHYAWTRFNVSEGGESQYLTQTVSAQGYHELKRILPEPLITALFGTGKCRASPPTLSSLMAAFQGASDGLKDYNEKPNAAERLLRGETVEMDTITPQERDYLEGKLWA